MIRKPNPDEEKALEGLCDSEFTTTELAGCGITVPMVEKLRTERQPFTVAKLRVMARTAMRQDPEAAIRMLSAILGADEMGIVISRAVEVRGTAEVRTEEMEAVAAVAKVVDADLTSAPLEERVALAGAAVRETTEAYRALQKLQAQPQLALGVR